MNIQRHANVRVSAPCCTPQGVADARHANAAETSLPLAAASSGHEHRREGRREDVREQRREDEFMESRISSRPDPRLRKHADYQRVYRDSRKQFSASMSYFYALRPQPPAVPDTTREAHHGPRVGLTAGRVMGKAVDRNRIKRRMREAVRRNIDRLSADVDVVLHPRRSVLTMEFSALDKEVARVFSTVQTALNRGGTR